MRRRFRRWLAYSIVILTILRGLIFLARLGGVIGTVEAVAITFGYSDAVTEFEDTIDLLAMMIVQMMTVGWSLVFDRS